MSSCQHDLEAGDVVGIDAGKSAYAALKMLLSRLSVMTDGVNRRWHLRCLPSQLWCGYFQRVCQSKFHDPICRLIYRLAFLPIFSKLFATRISDWTTISTAVGRTAHGESTVAASRRLREYVLTNCYRF